MTGCELNTRQRSAIIAGVLVVLALALCPPWKQHGRYGFTFPLENRPLFAPPERPGSSGYFAPSVDFGRLSLYWLVVVGVTGIAIYALRKRASIPAQDDSAGRPRSIRVPGL